MESIKVGEYVRTEIGTIGKVVRINEMYFTIENNRGEIDILYERNQKHSKNIIDLIEEGDYIDGKRVEKNKYGELYTSYVYYGGDIGKQCEVYTEWIDEFKNEDIISVATKEQFSNMEYKL